VRLRVVTYNVHGFRGGVDPVASVLSPIEPDVVCIQECGSRRSLRRLCAALGVEAVSSHRPFSRVRNAVLYGMPLRQVEATVRELSREGRESRRGFVAVTLEAHGTRMAAMSAHLGLTPRQRRRHAGELRQALAAIAVPVVLGVDLNEEPDGPSVRGLAAALHDASSVAGRPPGNTFPARSATDRIDVVLATKQFRVVRAWVPLNADAALASDHLPVVADLDLGP
jgi:endonuclease/exonuclease/phosphatase family metal-dependent hydrolase